MCQSRIILIGGSSHVGKSTLAEFIAAKLGWPCISTDRLARHPGRPWKTGSAEIPRHVAEHYLSLSPDELIEDVLSHYKNLWPRIQSILTEHLLDRSTTGLIVEGSALWPESVATLNLDNIAAVWLTASDDCFQERIYRTSQFEGATTKEKIMIQKFLDRTLRYNQRMMEAISQRESYAKECLTLKSLNVESASSLDDLSNQCLKLLFP
jgi:2-phosphoglycerate kinase